MNKINNEATKRFEQTIDNVVQFLNQNPLVTKRIARHLLPKIIASNAK